MDAASSASLHLRCPPCAEYSSIEARRYQWHKGRSYRVCGPSRWVINPKACKIFADNVVPSECRTFRSPAFENVCECLLWIEASVSVAVLFPSFEVVVTALWIGRKLGYDP